MAASKAAFKRVQSPNLARTAMNILRRCAADDTHVIDRTLRGLAGSVGRD